jgi:tRNA-intron endonuclease
MDSGIDMVKGYFYGTRVVIWDVDDARRVWSLGFFGKPIGVPKPKSPDFNSPLLLDLLEAFYLYEKGVLEIYDKGDEPVDMDRFKRICRRSYEGFDEKYLVYSDLRDKGLVVLSGLKFGVDFAVYRKGPGLEHAPYLIDVVYQSHKLSGDDLIRAGRLATTVRKRFILAVPNLVNGTVKYIMFTWWRP